MKPIDLYQIKPQTISKCLGHLKGFHYNHLEEVDSDNLFGLEEKNEKVEIKYYADYCFDGRRSWTLASVWFENQPVMVIQNAGREGDDHRNRFITNESLFREMVKYIRSLLEEETERELTDLINENDDYTGLDNFYGVSLSELYDPAFQPAYQVGDIVEAFVAENPLTYFLPSSSPLLKKKVRILDVYEFNRYDTYRVEEFERHITGKYDWGAKTDTRKLENVLDDQFENKIYCRLNSDLRQIH